MSTEERFLILADLLLGAAYADDRLEGSEEDAVRGLLEETIGGALPIDLEARVANFDPQHFDVKKSVAAFKVDPAVNKRQLLQFVAAVSDSDEEADLAEDEYLRALASALGMSKSEYKDLALDYQIEDIGEVARQIGVGPPPAPRK